MNENSICLVIELKNVEKEFNDINYCCNKIQTFIDDLRNFLEYEYTSYSFITNFNDGASEMKILICYNELENDREKEEVENSFNNILFNEQLEDIIFDVFKTRDINIIVDGEVQEDYEYIEPEEYVDPYNDEELIASSMEVK